MFRQAAVVLAASTMILAACGSSHREGLRADSGAETTTTVAAVGDPGDGTATTLPGETTTTTTEATTTTVPPFTRPPRSTTTTVAARRLVSNSTPSPSSTTTAAPAPATTVAGVTTTSQEGATTTTKPLETVAALTIGKPGAASTSELQAMQRAIPEGLDFAKLASDLAAQGYQTGKVRFRDSRGGAVPDPIEQNVNETRASWKAMFDGAGGKKVAGLLTTDGSAGSHAYADLVVAQIDAIFKESGGGWYAGIAVA
jgi:hypothetical protein